MLAPIFPRKRDMTLLLCREKMLTNGGLCVKFLRTLYIMCNFVPKSGEAPPVKM